MRDLAKLLVQVRGLNARRHIALTIVNISVPSNEKGLPKFDDFDGNKKRDRHHVCEEEHPGEENCEELLNKNVPLPLLFLVFRPVHVNIGFINRQEIPHSTPTGRYSTKDALDSEDDKDRLRDHLFKIGLLLL